MQQNLPFNFKEVFKLTNLGLNTDLFKFGSVTFESQKYICVKDAAVSAPNIHSPNFSNIFQIQPSYRICLIDKSNNIQILQTDIFILSCLPLFEFFLDFKVFRFYFDFAQLLLLGVPIFILFLLVALAIAIVRLPVRQKRQIRPKK